MNIEFAALFWVSLVFSVAITIRCDGKGLEKGNEVMKPAELGHLLFEEKLISGSQRISCASCHSPVTFFASGKSKDKMDNGKLARRNTPSLLDVGRLRFLGWDGRYQGLNEQALDPFSAWNDMGLDAETAVKRLNESKKYKQFFISTYGKAPTVGTLTSALAAYERSLKTGISRFDRFFMGNENSALTPEELSGFRVFAGKAHCSSCHSIGPPGGKARREFSPLFTDQKFHFIGTGLDAYDDLGRYYFSQDEREKYAFRTPSLRNVALTAPYMHDGHLKTLEDVVDFYCRKSRFIGGSKPTFKSIQLTYQEKKELVSFLKSLNSPR